MKNLGAVGAFVVALIAPASAWAAASGADFLKIPVGAAPAAMGGAYVAVPDELSAAFWNPAELIERRSLGAELGHLSWLGSTGLEEFAVTGSTGATGMGLGATLFHADRTDATDPANPLADRTTAPAGDFSARINFARDMGGGILAGASLQLLQRSLPGTVTSVLGAGAGFVWRDEERRLRVGAEFGDWGPPIEVDSVVSEWPTHLRLGASWIPLGDVWAASSRLLLAAEVDKIRDPSPPQWHVGAELTFAGVLALRVGIQHGGAEGPLTAGLGYRIGPAVLDYAYVPYLELGSTHRFSLRLHFGKPPRPVTPPPAPPTDLRAAVSGSTLYVSWRAPNPAPAGYALYLSRGAGLLERAPGPEIHANLFVLSNYDPTETYYFEVAAVDSEGREGEQSVPLAFAPQIPEEELLAEIETALPPPDTITRWTASEMANATPEMDLPIPADVARVAKLAGARRGIKPPPVPTIALIPSSAPTTAPEPVAVLPSLIAPIDRPWKLAATTASGVLRLEWSDPPRAPLGYRIYISTRKSGPYRPLIQDVLKGNRFEIQGLPAGRAFYFVVTSVWADGSEGPYSDSIAAIP